jgi:Fe-S cluster biosynthesis and repair protein YggX
LGSASITQGKFLLLDTGSQQVVNWRQLEKKSIAGPHRCELCRSSSETAKHLFMECNFAKEVWSLILHELKTTVPQFNSVADLFDAWNQCYPNKIPSKSFWRKVWNAIPKYVCWQIWLTRNDLIFNEKQQAPFSAAAKAKAFLLEAAQQQYFSDDALLLPEEERWLGPLSPSPSEAVISPSSSEPGLAKKRLRSYHPRMVAKTKNNHDLLRRSLQR